MNQMKTIAELDIKMKMIADSVGMSIDQFRKLPRKKFIAICNQYNENIKNK